MAVLPVVVHTATDESDYLSKGLAQMLSARLEQAGGIDVALLGDPSQATDRRGDGRRQCGYEVNADFVIFGSFTQFGNGASLDMRCARVAGTDSGRRLPKRARSSFNRASSGTSFRAWGI